MYISKVVKIIIALLIAILLTVAFLYVKFKKSDFTDKSVTSVESPLKNSAEKMAEMNSLVTALGVDSMTDAENSKASDVAVKNLSVSAGQKAASEVNIETIKALSK